MRFLTIALVLCLCGMACTLHRPKSSAANPDQLPSTFYEIDPNRDTTVRTARGALLTIPAGAFGDSASAASGTILLEVKEAYTLTDIVRGRLVTTSHGEALSSGGMIYVNVAGAPTMKLHKPIQVSIPTKKLQEGMKLYTGVMNDSGRIDWVDPRPLMPTKADQNLAIGKALFVSNCASCHSVGKVITGPPLAWICNRGLSKKWLYQYIHDNTKLLAKNDPYACYLFNEYNKTPMNRFPDLGDKAIDQILAYIMNESQTIDSTTIHNNRMSFDSCLRYTRLTASLQEKRDRLVGRRGNLVAANGPEVVDNRFKRGKNLAPADPQPAADTAVWVEQRESVYYQFQINATGWYNCDQLLEGRDGVAESTLRVRVLGAHRREANIYLAVPGVKVLMQGGELQDSSDVYVFHTIDGKLLLPQGVPAFILCMGEDSARPFWAEVQWTTALSQRLTIEPVAMSKDAINTALSNLHLDDLNITLKDSKYAARIATIDQETRVTDSLLRVVSAMKPKFCNCDCGLVETVPVEAKRDSAALKMQ